MASNALQWRRAIENLPMDRSEQRAVPSIGTVIDGLPPNGLAFSRRERGIRSYQKSQDLAREAVGLQCRVIRMYLLPRVGSLEQRARRMLSCSRCETGALAGPSVWASRRCP